MRFGKQQLQGLLFYMMLAGKLESALARLHREKDLTSPLTLRSGLEAVSVGSGLVLATQDTLASSLPSVGALLLRGVKPVEIVLRFLGKGPFPSAGRDGLRQFGDLSRGIIATAGHAAAHVSVMAGLAFSYRVLDQTRAALALVSEEAVATGDFHEGLNFAAVRKAPLVVVVARFPASGSRAGSSLGSEVTELYERARGYGIAGVPVDGSDVLQVVQVVKTALDRARAGEGASLIEARVGASIPYRGSERATPSPFARAETASPEDEADGGDAEPLRRFERFLLQQDWLGESELRALSTRAEGAVSRALHEAESAPHPSRELLENGVFNAPRMARAIP